MANEALDAVERLIAKLRDVRWRNITIVGAEVAGTMADAANALEALSITRTEPTSLLSALDEIANASWPSVNGDDPVKRIQDFAKQAMAGAEAAMSRNIQVRG